MGDDEYIENYFQRDNEQQLKLRVEKLSDWDKDFQTKVIQSALLMYDKKRENWDGQLEQLQPKIGELTADCKVGVQCCCFNRRQNGMDQCHLW